MDGYETSLIPLGLAAVLIVLGTCAAAPAGEVGRGPVFGVIEIPFKGPACKAADAPARDIAFWTRFRHESGKPEVTVHGFWDGDGQGGREGNVFNVRFCPTTAGTWTLAQVHSSDKQLAGQHEGGVVVAAASDHPGFWLVDPHTPGGRWYRRSDGSHPYIFGNTHYAFLSQMDDRGPRPGDIAADMAANAGHLNKVRFSIHPCRYPNPKSKPFLDDSGRPTDDGDFSHRPNPEWFHTRVDVAVRAAWEKDIVADLILCGPDTREARSVLRASKNRGDATPILRYVAARYGSYPNVWMCLANEWNIKDPKYTAEEIKRFGAILRRHLPYATPVSVHASSGPWDKRLNARPPWNDHVILQDKIRTLARSADAIAGSHAVGGGDRPVINDELGYEGKGDAFSRDDVIEGHLGAFLGGGYGTTGHKPASKKGHYFWGGFTPQEHTAVPHLAWLRKVIDSHITFCKMAPIDTGDLVSGAGKNCRAMAWPGNEFVLGTSGVQEGLAANLPAGPWEVRRFDVIAMKEEVLARGARGRFTFAAPASRAVLFHFKKVGDASAG
ncbi:MAG: hypothetical protein AMK72_07500 [Planctomycetes bacterium SM23_25]|nr:MAG: hypothetical protein AMK72_07500 [Planctomycetes bacterium SM23_25]